MAHARTSIVTAALTAAMLAAPSASFAAPVPSTIALVADADNVTVHQVQQQLRALGFTDLGTIARDGGIFELPAVWEGEAVDLRVDASTRTIRLAAVRTDVGSGRPTSMTLAGEPHEVSVPQVVSGLRDLGFTGISGIRNSGRIFEAAAMWQGTPFDLRYDASSGTISDRSATTARAAEEFPRIVFAGAPHETSVQDISRGLAALGFSRIADIQKDGRIYTASATWQGEALDLRVDAANRRITRR